MSTRPSSRRVCSTITTASAPGGNRRAGHDLDRLPGGDFAGEPLAGAHLADDFQLARQIDGAHRVAVADGARQRRGIAVGRDIFRQHAPGGLRKRNLLDGGERPPAAHVPQNGLASIHKS